MAAPSLSMNEIRKRAAAFAADWADETRERGESQTFWNEFLQVFGINRRRVASFEKQADRLSTGNHGFIDLFWPGMLLVEQKSASKDLDAADAQAFDYLNGLSANEFPNAVVVSDFARIRITRFDGKDGATTAVINTADLSTEIDRFTFLAGYVKRDFTASQEEAVNAEAVRLMSLLYQAVAGDHFSDHETSVFMTRVLFLLFGDDTGLWPRGLFSDLIEQTADDGEAVAGVLTALFRALDRPEDERSSKLNESIAQFPYVNGGLFTETLEVPLFDSTMRRALVDCCGFDWGQVSPDVFGSMFQSVKAKVDRRAHGEHYTTPENIRKTINPLFLDDLRAELEGCGKNVKKLQAFHKSLADYRYMDPACGCGNFLVVAYREMRALELETFRRIRDLTNNEVLDGFEVANTLNVRPDQFFGIEIEEWPAAIARTAMFLVDHQANLDLSQEFGQAPDRLPISDTATIVIGNAISINWATLVPAGDKTLVFGNPPFVGMSRMSAEQREDNRAAFSALAEAKGERTGRLDYVACWYAKALVYARGTGTRFAFVSTNSITQGDQARAMDPIFRRTGISIDFAHRTFKWSSGAANAAAVFCTIIGFSATGTRTGKRLFDYPDVKGQPLETTPTYLNFWLVDSALSGPRKRNHPLLANLPKMHQGSKPWDNNALTIKPEDYESVTTDAVAAKFLRPYRQSKEMLNDLDRWCLWMIDAQPSELLASPIIRSRLEVVKAVRLTSDTPAANTGAKTSWLFLQRRQPDNRYLAVPEVSSENRDYVPMRYYEPDVIAGNKLMVIDGCPLWLFGYLQSAAFTDWVKAFAGRLKADPSISPDLTYNAFPFIESSPSRRKQIERAAQAILDARDQFPNEDLASLYVPLTMPRDLRSAHENLDKLIDGMFGMKKPTSAIRVAMLLAKHHELIAAEQILPRGAVKQKGRQATAV